MRNVLLSIATVAVLLLSVGCGSSPDLVNSEVEKELTREVGPADSYHVDVQGLQFLRGHAETVVANGIRVHPKGGPVIANIHADLTDVQYNATQKKLEHVGGVVLTCQVKTDDLADFLRKQRNVEEVALSTRPPDVLVVEGRPQWENYHLPSGLSLAISGRIVGRGPHLDFDVLEVAGAGLGASISFASPALASETGRFINPLIDLSRSPVHLNVTQVSTETGMVVLTATGTYP